MTVTVDTYFYTTESVRQIVPHTTEEIGIDTIPRGDVNILEEGADGESILHYTVTYKNGMEYDRRLDWEEVLTAMVPARAEVGVGGTFVGGDGVTYSYSWKKICKATYYNLVGLTYSGNYTTTRTVATNLDYIPIGTRMYIKNDRYDFGYRVSEDTGHLDPWQVDIWMMDDDPNAPLMSIEGVVRDMEVYFLD
ncbi:MAG: G5 domain-containing protein [Clostridiales bacterium]|nr:G5 domain-containing protein [Clostridiales bacterium]